jgi:hypothetical protein
MEERQAGTGFSAEVRMELRVHDQVLSIGQLGPDFLILENPADHPPADAEITVWIDGRERRWKVHLPDGIESGKIRTRTSRGAVQSR